MERIDFDQLTSVAINLTRELVLLPSESSGAVASVSRHPEQEVAARLVAFCKWHGLDAQLWPALEERSNVLVRIPRKGAPRVLLAAHMDTVSGKGMKEPFSGELREGKIWGRGACDDKGPLACAVATVAVLAAARREFFCDLTLAATVDEECTLAGAAALARETGDDFDLIIAFEPTGQRIVRAHKGDYRVRITTAGKAVHSSMPEQGINAITKMFELLAGLEELAEEFRQQPETDLGKPTLAVTTISGGSSGNIIPDRCEATVDIRLLPEMDIAQVAGRVERIVGDRGTVEVLFAGRGIRTAMENSAIRRLQECIRQHGGDPSPIIATYATDCSQLQDRGDCIVWGPGDVRYAHHVDEHIEISEIDSCCRILAAFLLAAAE
jgi:acetylornithine deacetylase/succinyl-diaminopimelate desuccinylase family protein